MLRMMMRRMGMVRKMNEVAEDDVVEDEVEDDDIEDDDVKGGGR